MGSIDQIDWLPADNQVKLAMHQLNAAVQVVHPHIDARVKYDVLASVKVVHGQLVLHELVKLHPDVAVHSGFLLDVAHADPATLIVAASPILHFLWMAYRL